MARTRLTRELGEAIVKDLASGLYANQVALRNGLHRHTLAHWVERGLREGAGELEQWFAEAYIKAEIEVERKTIETIRAAAEPWEETRDFEETLEYDPDDPAAGYGGDDHAVLERRDYCKQRHERALKRGDWGAAAWFAEKRWPKRWGSRAPMKGHESATDDLPVTEILAAAETRAEDINSLVAQPPPELEEALLRNKDAVLALFAAAEAEAQREKG